MGTNDFWSRVATGDGCWEWMGSRSDRGYGQLRREGRLLKAHRLAYELAVGPIPTGLSVLHSCDNRACVRPDHLRVGSQRDNMADMDARGRRRSPFVGQVQAGERNRNARLSAVQVAHIRGMLAAGYYYDDIAARFGVTLSNIGQIARGYSWRGVTDVVPYPPAVRDRPLGRRPRRAA